MYMYSCLDVNPINIHNMMFVVTTECFQKYCHSAIIFLKILIEHYNQV